MTSAVNGRCFQARSPAWLVCALPRHPCFLPPTQEAGAAALNCNRDDSSKQKPNQASGGGANVLANVPC